MPENTDALARLARKPVALTIDIHRGHLDPDVATLPLPADRCGPYVERTAEILAGLREVGVPVIHVITYYRDRGEIVSNPYWELQAELPNSSRARIADHNLDGSPGLELMPGIEAPGDKIVSTKKRYDCLVGTDLEWMLRSSSYDSVLVFGVNTNSCVLATSIALSVRDWATFMVEDGIDSMMGPEYHDAAVKIFAGSFGWVLDGDTATSVLRESLGAALPTG
jgi:nicotinamidase-related amidase